jgi:heme-degrading monooxygenase HmoA
MPNIRRGAMANGGKFMFAVIFEVEPKPERRGEYLGLAAFLKPELEKIDGFLENERFASTANPERVLSLSLWRDEKAVIRWRTLQSHHEVQAKGRSEVFRDYHLRVGEVTADTGSSGEAPTQRRFDETETGVAKVVTITESRPDGATSGSDPVQALGLRQGTDGLLGWEVFESIYNQGKLLILASWRDAASAETWMPERPAGMDTRHRHVRVIRDYGMFDRREAPQYYPPAGQKMTGRG